MRRHAGDDQRVAVPLADELPGVAPHAPYTCTPEILRGCAELAVEFEAISRYLAPRRFLERRTSTGTPSPVRTREYLGREEASLGIHDAWLAEFERKITSSSKERERLVAEVLANVV